MQEQLQIGEFIREPASLKLLILAGTKIKVPEIATVSRCLSLIKLDLSNNQLPEIPLHFNTFPLLRILYLHNNQLTAINISHTKLQYISLFGNPLPPYRAQLIETNVHLLAIDTHVVTSKQRVKLSEPEPHCQLKWPIVEVSSELQREEDYLNLLKAELFVIGQVHRRATHINTINGAFQTVKQMLEYQIRRKSHTQMTFFRVEAARKAAQHWVSFTKKKRKLRQILKGTPAESCLLNLLERTRANRSSGVTSVLNSFLSSVRAKMRARKVLQKALISFRLRIPALSRLQQFLSEGPIQLYFRQSQMDVVDRLLLYVRKLFFNLKDYDVLDNFTTLVAKTSTEYLLLRKSDKQSRRSQLLDMIQTAIGSVVIKGGRDRRHLLYNKRGHRWIQVKRASQRKTKVNWERVNSAQEKIERLYSKYDRVICITIKNTKIHSTLLHLLRYYNAGNTKEIDQNRAAYFQTQIPTLQKDTLSSPIAYTCRHLFERALAATVIQRVWRGYKVRKNSDLVTQLRQQRAGRLIGRWLRDMKFRHRQQLAKELSILKMSKQHELYIQMDIYMALPKPNDLLGLGEQGHDLYRLLHTRTESQLVWGWGRKWLKLRFQTLEQAGKVRQKLAILTYRYFFNGSHLSLLTSQQILDKEFLEEYERRINRLWKIKITRESEETRVHKVDVENPGSFFLWPFVEEGFASMFKPEQVQSMPISVFIYNKNRRPLKVNCDLLWTSPSSLYFYKRGRVQIRVKTPKKQVEQLLREQQQTLQLYKMPHMRHRLNRQRQYSMKQHTSLLQSNRRRGHSQLLQLSLLSQTLNIKRP